MNVNDVELIRLIERMPMRAVRWTDINERVPNAARVLSRLAQKGALARVATGVYVVPPNGVDGRAWKAPLEAAALAVATARFGQRRAALMGVGAARFWQAIPRAIAVTTVAVPVEGRHPVTLVTGGTVHFIQRDLDRLDLTLERTSLGDALVTTPAQTLFDLLARPGRWGADIADEAVHNLAARVDRTELEEVAAPVTRVPNAVRAHLARMGPADV